MTAWLITAAVYLWAGLLLAESSKAGMEAAGMQPAVVKKTYVWLLFVWPFVATVAVVLHHMRNRK